jgi:hypothetical protein
MLRYTAFALCLSCVIPTQISFAQDLADIYVSAGPPGGNFQVNAYTAAANGQLTPVPGSPFADNVQNLSGTGKYLFGDDGVNIYSYSIASSGAITQVASTNAQQYNGDNCGGPVQLFFDRTGDTLYDRDYYCDANNGYQYFRIDTSNGDLTYLGTSDLSTANYVPLSFLANNLYAYGAQCNGNMYWSIFGYKRNSDGSLTVLDGSFPVPKPKTGDFYCPNLTTADKSNHVVISMQPVLQSSFGSDGNPQVASYTADGSGNLSTSNTNSNMPRTLVQNVYDLKFSPSGELVAVAGSAGLQIFHFNGAQPLTKETGLVTANEIDQIGWDKNNHLYAISQTSGKLFVFTATPTGVTQAPGSPHSIPNAFGLAVIRK